MLDLIEVDDQYMPTTEEVRRAFFRSRFNPDWEAYLAAGFDRWLAEVARAAAEKAWDEGRVAGGKRVLEIQSHSQAGVEIPREPTNPYRAEQIGENRG